MTKECKCRWCQRPTTITREDEEYLDHLLTRLDYYGEMSLTEDQQALVHFGPLCDECEKNACTPIHEDSDLETAGPCTIHSPVSIELARENGFCAAELASPSDYPTRTR